MKRALLRILHYGRKHYCNVCCAHVREWIKVGLDNEVFNNHIMVGAGRRKRGCPVCHSTDRDRLMLDFVQDYFKSHPQSKDFSLLHIAPESYLISLLNEGVKDYFRGDAFAPGYAYDTRNTEAMDIQQLRFEDCTLDWVIANHVLEHVADDHRAMQEIFRVLKPGGRAVLQVPMALDLAETIEARDEKDLEKVTGQYDHRRLYGLDYLLKLQAMGFQVEEWQSKKDNQKMGFNPNESVIQAIKAKA